MFWFCVSQSDSRKSYIQIWLSAALYILVYSFLWIPPKKLSCAFIFSVPLLLCYFKVVTGSQEVALSWGHTVPVDCDFLCWVTYVNVTQSGFDFEKAFRGTVHTKRASNRDLQNGGSKHSLTFRSRWRVYEWSWRWFPLFNLPVAVKGACSNEMRTQVL